MSEYTIQLATEDDLEGIILLNANEYWENQQEWKDADIYERYEKAMWWADYKLLSWHISILKQCSGGILVAKYSGNIVAELDFVQSVDYYQGKHITRIHIIWVLVHKDWRGKGLAQKLIDELKERFPNKPIWVEPEDERSETLYKKQASLAHNISNWQYNLTSIPPEHNFSFKTKIQEFLFDEFDLLDQIQKRGWRLILGRYYAPSYDMAQLTFSFDAYEFIWGQTVPQLVKYDFMGKTALAVITQYPRLLANDELKENELKEILLDLSQRIAAQGFDPIYLQVYDEPHQHSIFESCSYTNQSNLDPVFQLEP